jgi:hypothetical protein
MLFLAIFLALFTFGFITAIALWKYKTLVQARQYATIQKDKPDLSG